MAKLPAPGATLRSAWRRLSPLPGGKWVFWLLIRFLNPYTGRLGARVELLEPGHSRVRLRERRGVRNHLASVHAVALANLGEVTTGLAMLAGLPATVRGILTGLRITYHRKARGVLTAEARCRIPRVTEDTELEVRASIRDAGGTEVATVHARWRVGPVPETAG